ncbi:MAG: hypothetical protein C4320_03940, partial [Armatimonadota bacterium]
MGDCGEPTHSAATGRTSEDHGGDDRVRSDLQGQITSAAEAIKRGDLITFPTETVYGLAADATNPLAVQKVFSLKRRPATNPLIVHVADTAMLTAIADGIPEAAWGLIAAY